jgi:hypothetical protein
LESRRDFLDALVSIGETMRQANRAKDIPARPEGISIGGAPRSNRGRSDLSSLLRRAGCVSRRSQDMFDAEMFGTYRRPRQYGEQYEDFE